MYLDIGNNTLIDEKEIIAVVNVSDRFFTDFKKDLGILTGIKKLLKLQFLYQNKGIMYFFLHIN